MLSKLYSSPVNLISIVVLTATVASCKKTTTTKPPTPANSPYDECSILSTKRVRGGAGHQNRTRVYGVVQSSGNPMDGLTVRAVDRFSELQYGEPSFDKFAYTDSERGAFDVELPANRVLALEFLHGSSMPCAVAVELAPNEELLLSIDVEPRTGEDYLLID